LEAAPVRLGLHNSSFISATDGAERIFPEVRDHAQWPEKHGFDYMSFMDHLWQIPPVGPADEPFLEAWVTLGAVAVSTERIQAHDDGLQHRLPEPDAYGFEFPRTGVRLGQLRDGVKLIKAMWSDERATYEGKHFVARDPSEIEYTKLDWLCLAPTAEKADAKWEARGGRLPEGYRSLVGSPEQAVAQLKDLRPLAVRRSSSAASSTTGSRWSCLRVRLCLRQRRHNLTSFGLAQGGLRQAQEERPSSAHGEPAFPEPASGGPKGTMRISTERSAGR
jgi:alkanesulfonate monooxygenase SsuD/methylene tetrahydromethanopterin reductase-like flavin-dependent oxidoreductase (luciferase family)